jgi:hypothetical protein
MNTHSLSSLLLISVEYTQPSLEGVLDMVQRLNTTNDFSYFVQSLRRKFHSTLIVS